MTPTQLQQQADGHHEQQILAEHELAETRVVLESLDATDPTEVIRVPAAPYGYRMGTIEDAGPFQAGRAVSLLDAIAQRVHHGVVRSWSGEGLNIDEDIHLTVVDDDLEVLPDTAPVTDGKRYWLLVPEDGR